MSTSTWLADQQEHSPALDLLRQTGLPQRRDEYWRFTQPAPFFEADLTPAMGEPLSSEAFGDFDGYVITLENGRLSGDLPLMDGAMIKVVSDDKPALWGALAMAAQSPVARPGALVAMARAQTRLWIDVKGTVDKPILINHKMSDAHSDSATHIALHLAQGAGCTLIENGPRAARSMALLELFVADEAQLDHVDLGHAGLSCTAQRVLCARMGRASRLHSTHLCIHSGISRNEMWVEMLGDEAQLSLGGASFAQNGDHDDHTVFITHDSVGCESRQIFKKALTQGACGVFQGKILVKEHAQKTDGYQMSQSLLLEDGAEFLAKPELEIYADDVACSHGSTSGAIDEQSLFYLRARGVPKAEAMRLLTLSFLADAVAEIENDEIEERVNAVLAHWLSATWGAV